MAQPTVTVTHSCGHPGTYRDVPWLRGAERPCFECAAQELPPYDDPFKD